MVVHTCSPSSRKLRQKDQEFKASSGYIARPCLNLNNKKKAGHRWLTPVILATQEAEIRRIGV
jgi:hypothetical protein